MDSIIQWNCRGLRHKLDEIKLIIKDYNPIAFCLQETYLKENEDIQINNYTCYKFSPPILNDKVSGGVCILVRNDIPHSEIQLQTPLQSIAIQIAMKKQITLCSIYLPPNSRINPRDLDNLLTQLPTPHLLLGDYNAHNKLWGCRRNNGRGTTIENFILNNNLCYLNDKSPTHVDPRGPSTSAIDLSFCHPSIYLDFTWRVGEELCGSDHYPIFLEHSLANPNNKISKWILHRADWDRYKQLCQEHINHELLASDDPVGAISSNIIEIAEECIPKSSTNAKRPYYPWFNESCRIEIKK